MVDIAVSPVLITIAESLNLSWISRIHYGLPGTNLSQLAADGGGDAFRPGFHLRDVRTLHHDSCQWLRSRKSDQHPSQAIQGRLAGTDFFDDPRKLIERLALLHP